MDIAPVIQPHDLEELMAQRATIRMIDVRTPGEFESAHLPGAYNVPLDALPEHAAEIAADSNTHFVLNKPRQRRCRGIEEGG